MNVLVVNVTKDGRETPVFLVAPNGFTEAQVMETIHVVDGVDGCTVAIHNLGAIDDQVLDECNIGSFDAFFPDGWKDNY